LTNRSWVACLPAFHDATSTNPGRTSEILAALPFTSTCVLRSYGTAAAVPSRSLTATVDAETDWTTPCTLSVPEPGAGAVVERPPEDEPPEDELPDDELPEDELPDDELPPWLASAGAAQPSASTATQTGAARRRIETDVISRIFPARDYRRVLHL
jgi:hypothetical protein